MSNGAPERAPEAEVSALRARIQELEEKVAACEAYTDFFERSPAMLCIARGEHIIRVNAAWERILGWTPEEIYGQPFFHLIHPDDVTPTLEIITKLQSGEPAIAFENRYRCKNGSYRHLRWFTAPLDAQGHHHAVAQDITLEKNAEAHARVYEDTILNSSTGILVIQLERPGDPHSFRLVMANEAAQRFIKGDLRKDIGGLFVEIFPGAIEGGLLGVYMDVAMTGGSRDLGEVTYGDERVDSNTFAVRAFALPDYRVCINFENITERKKVEEALRQSIRQEEIIRAQAATLAELSTPLIPLSDDVLVMPLIGAVDAKRAEQVISTLLAGISTSQARTAILDITGVAVVDTQVADALIRAAKGVKLLGARVMLTGIRPEVARTLVELAVDLGGIMTHSSLQAGIAAALRGRKA